MTFKPRPTHPFHQNWDQTLVIAHRGGSGERPENTMLAFKHARDIGVDALELDVHMTRDGVLAIIHDDTVNRTTDGTGRVTDLSYAELSELDAGYNFEEESDEDGTLDYPYRNAGVRIPTLEEMLSEFASLRMLIEIKPNRIEVADIICQAIRNHDAAERVIVSSFHEKPLRYFRRVCPEVATSATESEVRLFFVLHLLGLERMIRPAYDTFALPLTTKLPLVGEIQLVDERFVRSAALHNIPIDVWTVNEETEILKLLKLEVTGIITGFPSRVIELRQNFAKESSQ